MEIRQYAALIRKWSWLIFLLILLNDEGQMGEHVNTRWQNVVNWSIVIVVIAMSTLLGVQTLFPELFG